MSDVLQRTAALSPEKLALLQKRLKLKKSQEGKEEAPADRKIARRKGGGPAPLSFAQERLWFIDRLQPGSPAYNIPESFPLSGPLDLAALARSLAEIARRHEALRTWFAEEAGRPVQVIEPSLRVDLPVVDLRALSEEARQAEIRRLAAEQVQLPFDLGSLPLWRVLLVRLSAASHLLFLTLHHIISDAWSIGVFYRELGSLYDAFRADLPTPLPELPIQYADFAAWQREWLQGERLEAHLSYWKQQLAGAPALLALPTDRPRPAVLTFRGALRTFLVPAPLHRELRTLSYRERTTLFMTALAAFEALLHRYSGQDDLVVATPVASRGRREIEGLIGFFLNTLVLRTRLAGDPTFRQVMMRVRETLLAAHAHQDLPFEKLVQELRPDRNLSANPLFQVMFVLQSAQAPSAAGEVAAVPDEAASDPLPPAATGTSRFDCTLSLVESAGRLIGTFEYNVDLFDATTIQRMEGHFLTLLGGIADPDRCLSELPLLTPAERQILAEWNDTAAPYPAGRTIHELFEIRVAAAPDAPALVFEDRELSYGELNALANRIAHRLRALGVGPEVRVGLLLDRSVEMIAGLLGILKAGGAYVPLDPTYPKDRLGFMLADARVPALLTREPLLALLPEHEARVVCVDTDRAVIEAESADNPVSGVTPDHPAYVIYTSGSTGRPKGVVVPHRGACSAAEVEVRLYGMRPADRVLQFASLNFDASVYELLMCFWGGATLVVARRDDVMPGPGLARLLREQRITTLPMPPSALAAVPVEDFPDLRLILVMGEACPQELVARWRPRARIFNAYGPTEATMWSAGGYLEPDRKLTIGRPAANERVHLLDPQLQPVPMGVPGELWIGGIGVTRGYLDRPGLTAERFAPDPFGGEPGARLYRTGDLARWLTDGEIEFLGRIDYQVKIRGFRIELGEIEAVLGRFPGVRDAVVIAREDLPTGRGLAAYVAADPRRPPTASELRAFVQERLPDYMVPAVFLVLDRLPLTPSGKIDRPALPAPDTSRPDLASAFVAPATATEERLAQIWAEVLGLQRVGVHNSFFDLGGHSLLATQIASRVRDVFGVEIPLRSLFETPTVHNLAERIERTAAEAPRRAPAPMGSRIHPAPAPSSVPPRPEAVDVEALSEAEVDSLLRQLLVGQKREILARLLKSADPGAAPRRPEPRKAPISFAQERLWFLDRLQPGSPAYNIPALLSLPPATDFGALRQTLNEIVRRHESLRTTFALEAGRPVQVVAPALELAQPVVDLGGLPEPARPAELQRIAALEAFRSFDLGKGPLLRAIAVRLGGPDGGAALVLTLHHIVADGWSMGILYRELDLLYDAFRAGQPSPLPELPLQYADYARWQRDWLRGEVLERQIAYWRGQLADAPAVLELPLDRPRPPFQTFRGALRSFRLPLPLAEALRGLGQQQGTTVFMTTLALFQALLWQYARQDRILVGSPIANRTRSEHEGLIGFFANTLVLGADFSGDPSFRDLLAQVRETTLGAYAHQDLPFEKLVEELQPQRSQNVQPIFQVMFSLDPPAPPQSAEGDPDEEAPPVPVPAKLDLVIHVAEAGTAIVGALEYNLDLFDDATMRRMIDHLEVLLEAVVAAPDRPLAEIAVHTPEDRRRLAAWNATEVPRPAPNTLQGQFEIQAKATPDAVAVSSAEGDLTFSELARRADQVAHGLRSRGVGPDVAVGLCMERSPDLIVGLLGVLKAGGAYVPLDPGYPRERLDLLIRDSGVKIALTQPQLRPILAELGDLETLDLDTAAETSGRPDLANHPEVDGRSLAYILYTSGSTGRPKGVMIPHAAVVNHMRWLQETWPLTGRDALLQKTPFHFDASVWEVFAPLFAGTRLVLARPGGHRDTAYLVEEVQHSGITVLQIVPSLLRVLLDEPGLGRSASLRRLFCGGEALAAEDAERFLTLLDAELVQLYGPTEAAIDVTSWTCRAGDPRRPLPIGGPIANTRIHLLDRGVEVPIGAPGELCAGGLGLARGYLGRPDLTAERFVPDPFAAEPGARLYRTGDLARRRPDGAVEFLRRIDQQIKIRGFRIEPGEIEAILAGHPALREVAVVPRADGPAPAGSVPSPELRLVAYVVPRNGAAPAAPELRDWLHERLPRHMVPAAFVTLPALPRTPSGKLDRRALPAPDRERPDWAGVPVLPSTSLEEVLTGIWTQVLGLESIGVADDFFELGGHSLLAVQALSRVRDALDVEWPLQRFFELPTPAGMAAALAREHGPILEKRAAMLLSVARLSDDEVKARLADGASRQEAAR